MEEPGPGDHDWVTRPSSFKRTEFACTRAGCAGTLVVGFPQKIQTDIRRPDPVAFSDKGASLEYHGAKEDPERAPFATAAATTTPAPSVRVWCNRCNMCLSPRASDALLAEAAEDRHRWNEAMSLAFPGDADGHLQQQNGSSTSSRPPLRSRPPPVAATTTPGSQTAKNAAAALVLQCTRWRDRRLSPDSMGRAEAHDLMTRLLVLEHDFGRAANHCGLSVQVLERVFAPEDRELGMELSKLAQLCFQAELTDQCIDACRRARISLQVCLRAGDEQLVELDMMEAYCREACSSDGNEDSPTRWRRERK